MPPKANTKFHLGIFRVKTAPKVISPHRKVLLVLAPLVFLVDIQFRMPQLRAPSVILGAIRAMRDAPVARSASLASLRWPRVKVAAKTARLENFKPALISKAIVLLVRLGEFNLQVASPPATLVGQAPPPTQNSNSAYNTRLARLRLCLGSSFVQCALRSPIPLRTAFFVSVKSACMETFRGTTRSLIRTM